VVGNSGVEQAFPTNVSLVFLSIEMVRTRLADMERQVIHFYYNSNSVDRYSSLASFDFDQKSQGYRREK